MDKNRLWMAHYSVCLKIRHWKPKPATYLSCKAVPLLLACLPEHNASACVPRLPLLSVSWRGESSPLALTKLTLVLLQLTRSHAAGPGPPVIINIHASYKIHSQHHRRWDQNGGVTFSFQDNYKETDLIKQEFVLGNISVLMVILSKRKYIKTLY